MKLRFAVALVSICFSGMARAGDLAFYCQNLGFSAGLIMDFRQDNTIISLVIEMLGNEGKDQFTIDMVINAYETPLFNTDAEKVAAAAAFRNMVELECFKMIAEPGAEFIVQQAIAAAQS